ncbi:venom protease-like [Chironomus tepperi]|uniref:venom protease-like n=1 Tax=Chironomus tepperi TaxID=113505 RepID=UPI00391F065C
MIALKIVFLIFCIVLNVCFTSANQRISAKKCKEYESITQVPYYIRAHPSFPVNTVIEDKCQRNGIALVIGGKDAQLYEFPHQALLGYQKPGERKVKWACGGSLISPNFILTAAHCLGSIDTGPVRYVKLGIINRLESNVKIYNVIETFKHEGYDPQKNKNDIALLKLNEIVTFNEYIYPICLPTQQYEESSAIATGFGRTAGENAASENLLKVTLEHFSFSKCQQLLNLKAETVFKDIMICYGHLTQKKDTCKGDSGGPLQIYNDDISKCTYTQIGIVSFGPANCGTEGIPSVYVNVYHYLDWIEGIVWQDEI